MNNCIFCKIADGQIKAQVVDQNPHVIAFRDVNPQAPVHILVIPRKHIERFSLLKESDMALMTEVFKMAQGVAKKENLDKDGFRLVTNDGRKAGQTVDHIHVHILGGRAMTWPPG